MPNPGHKWNEMGVSREIATVFCCETCGAIKVRTADCENMYVDPSYCNFCELEPRCAKNEEEE